ncbi:Hypothetical predicted protein [Mytilus galloprovincialis]|uniref:C-type lectin domain-containing protein n=1 Tax=Mytilus galloprovincialis TaxID=29158 RepID=A0A8B6F0L0_MYTGA|nr:Hypothetical predicted protein [Mytilus galloprovincialis]
MALCNHNNQCLSFFYNQDLRKCVLHRKLFYSFFAAPETVQQGWKYYSTQDGGTKICSHGYTHSRYLEFCFNVGYVYASIVSAKAACRSIGGQLSAIHSPEKQDFMEHIMDGRPYAPVYIDGEKQPDNTWRQEDGSLLTYFNWYPNEPNGDGNCIQLCTGDMWCDVRCDLIQRVTLSFEE